MTYIGPEEDQSYVDFWNQYPDPIDENGTSNPDWLNVFREVEDFKSVNADIDQIQNPTNCEEISCDSFDGDNDGKDRDFFPTILEYTSPTKSTWSRLERYTNLNFSNLPPAAAALANENIETLMSFETLREQICFLIDLLRPTGNVNPLVSFEKIASVFNLTRGAIVSHYKRGLEIRECSRPNILSDYTNVAIQKRRCQ
mgnify:FL=1